MDKLTVDNDKVTRAERKLAGTCLECGCDVVGMDSLISQTDLNLRRTEAGILCEYHYINGYYIIADGTGSLNDYKYVL